jgi:hypothetical protein
MDTLILETPTRCRLPDSWATSKAVIDALAWEDLGAKHEWRTWRDVQLEDDKALAKPGYKPHWFVAKYGRGQLDAKVVAAYDARFKTCLMRDAAGIYTHAGLAATLAERFDGTIKRAYILPPPAVERWRASRHPWPLRAFQEDGADAMLEHAVCAGGPVSSEYATGMGKSGLELEIVRRIGLPALILAPSVSIVGQLYASAVDLFGVAEVGRYYDRWKEPNRRVVVSTTAGVRCAKGKNLDGLTRRDVVVGDESHLLPATSLAEVISGSLGEIPYRFFLSGSQIRSDGAGLLLAGIIGPTVRRATLVDGVNDGILATPVYTQFRARSPFPAVGHDPVKLNRVHLHRNPEVAERTCDLVKQAVARDGAGKTLVAIDEISQFELLEPRLRGLRVGLAHSGKGPDLENIPPQYRKSDPTALVASLDAGDLDVLVGTSCVGTGTDFKNLAWVFDLVGLGSEVRIRQLTGRGTRLGSDGKKTEFNYVDFDVFNVSELTSAAAKRRRIFEAIMPGSVRVV